MLFCLRSTSTAIKIKPQKEFLCLPVCMVFWYCVLKHSADSNGVLIEYSDKEKTLLQYLENTERITVKECSDLLKQGRRASQRLLVNLVLSGIIRIHTTEKEEYYTSC